MKSFDQPSASQPDTVAEQLAEVSARVQQCESENARLTELVRDLKAGEQEQLRELTLLTLLLRREEERTEDTAKHLRWSAAVYACLQDQPSWWLLLPARLRRSRQQRMLKRAGLFDHQAYFDRYPDVFANGMDPLFHYLHHGIPEGRSIDRKKKQSPGG
jgi:hypothetical protein